MERNPNWVEAMQNELDRHGTLAFDYQGADCFNMCADVVKVMTGEDPFKKLRKYKSLRGAMRKLKNTGHETLGDLIASILPEVPPMTARRGDLAMLDDGIALGVVTGAVVVGKGEGGQVTIPLHQAKQAFRVG